MDSCCFSVHELLSVGSASIFLKVIPLKTDGCLSETSFLLFRNKRRKIAEMYKALIYGFVFILVSMSSLRSVLPSFYQEKEEERILSRKKE